MTSNGFRLGRFEVATFLDADCFEIAMAHIFPTSDPAALRGHAWLEPDHVDLARGLVKLGMHSFLIRTTTLNILVDTCIGAHKERPAHPAWHRRADTGYLAGLAALGLGPADIDLVFCTHLHADHVGWNTRLENGAWVPTFPRARYAMSRSELAYWAAAQAASDAPVNHGAYLDSVLPVIRHGQELLVAPGDAIVDGLHVAPLFGHTPGHLGLEMRSAGAAALFCGDAIHSAAQLVRPDWHSAFCSDPAQAIATRRAMLDRIADEAMLLCPAHFRGQRALRIVRRGDGYVPR